MKAFVAVVGALSLLAAGCDGVSSDHETGPKPCPEIEEGRAPSGSGSIALVAKRRQGGEVVVIDAGTGKARQLTRQSTPHGQADAVAWSPDGTRVAYSGGTGGWNDGAYDDIWVMEATGGKPKRLTSSRQDDWNPEWSPDGRMIAFDRQDDGWNWVYVVNADGTDLRRLTPKSGWSPAWSPQGRIAYWATYGIWSMKPNGGDKQRLVKAELPAGPPGRLDWSPDGRLLAYTLGTGLWVVRSDGRGRQKLFDVGKGSARNPTWSPDGDMIAWTQGDGDLEIYVVKRDGTGLRNLTDNERVADEEPSWAPDGSAIAFMRTCLQALRDDRESYAAVITVDGRDVRQISPHRLDPYGSGPAWSP